MTDVLPAGPAAQLGAVATATKSGPSSLSESLIWTFASAAMVLALMTPALWNGFPLIFPDSGGYLTRPIEGALTIGRSALYGLFLYAGVPLSFWPNALFQSALTIWPIVLTLRANALGGRPLLSLIHI